MRAIVKVAVQRDLGIALIPVDEKLAFHMTGRVMVSTLPKEFKDAPEGILPAVEHEIANDPRLQVFFTDERVINACGGVNAIEAWATQFTKCQYSKHDLPETILDTERVGNSAVRICPGCYKKSLGVSPKLEKIAARNTARWVVATAKHRLKSEGQLTIPELMLWAMLSGVFDLIPDDVARTVTDLPEPKVITGTRKESRWTARRRPLRLFPSRPRSVSWSILKSLAPLCCALRKPAPKTANIPAGLRLAPAAVAVLAQTTLTTSSATGRAAWEQRPTTSSLSRCAVNATTHCTRM
ncbi:TPA: DUF968 domain-containing protein [Serratia marcescens]|nr:DUF968 domain-containing protein [Serratia marcescens]HBL7109628.1 DUF968 domain-containing protein [Serratia marcescens]HBL7331663.1 DUF968 domain-containing protein [Serratia marcescens]